MPKKPTAAEIKRLQKYKEIARLIIAGVPTLKEIADRVNISTTTLRSWMREEDFERIIASEDAEIWHHFKTNVGDNFSATLADMANENMEAAMRQLINIMHSPDASNMDKRLAATEIIKHTDDARRRPAVLDETKEHFTEKQVASLLRAIQESTEHGQEEEETSEEE